MMRNFITILCALLVSAALSHNVNAHTVTADSAVSVVLGSVFRFPDGVFRPVCKKDMQIDAVLADIKKLSAARAHNRLFHIRKKRFTKNGKSRLKLGFSRRVTAILREECKDLRGTKFAPTEVVRELDIHGYSVTVVGIYNSFKGGPMKEGTFYTWFVNTEFKEPDRSLATQVVAGKWNRLRIDSIVRVPKGFIMTTERGLVEMILESAAEQPKYVGRSVLLNPGDSFIEYNTRTHFLDLYKRGWIQEFRKTDIVTFTEFVEPRQIHGMNVSILALDIETVPSGETQRFYTWVVDTEIIEPKSKRQAHVQ